MDNHPDKYNPAYRFFSVDVYAFDIHTVKSFDADLAFLSDSVKYDARYGHIDKQPVQSGDIAFRPFSLKSIQQNKFWKNYCERLDPSEVQLPFVAVPRTMGLRWEWALPPRPNSKQPFFQPRIFAKPRIFLNRLGWSTHIELKMRGVMRAEQLIQLLDALRYQPVFRVAKVNEPIELSAVFSRLAQQMSGGVKSDITSVTRYLLTSINSFDGPMPVPAYPSMDSLDQAMFVGLMMGKLASDSEVQEMEKGKKFSVTRYGKTTNFALSRQHETLLCPQPANWRFSDKKQQTSKTLKVLSCHASNMRFWTMMALALAHARHDNEAVANFNLERLSGRYKDAFCTSFLCTFLKDFCPKVGYS